MTLSHNELKYLNTSVKELREFLDVVLAASNGVECQIRFLETWKRVDARALRGLASLVGVMHGSMDVIRIKPQPKYRAWLPEEVPKVFIRVPKKFASDLRAASITDSTYSLCSPNDTITWFDDYLRVMDDGSTVPCDIKLEG